MRSMLFFSTCGDTVDRSTSTYRVYSEILLCPPPLFSFKVLCPYPSAGPPSSPKRTGLARVLFCLPSSFTYNCPHLPSSDPLSLTAINTARPFVPNHYSSPFLLRSAEDCLLDELDPFLRDMAPLGGVVRGRSPGGSCSSRNHKKASMTSRGT